MLHKFNLELAKKEQISLFLSELYTLTIPNFFGFDIRFVLEKENNLTMIMNKFTHIINKTEITQQAKISFRALSDEHKSIIFSICLHLGDNVEFKQLEILCRLSEWQIYQLYEHDLVNIFDQSMNTGTLNTGITLKNHINSLFSQVRPSSAARTLNSGDDITSARANCRFRSITP